MLYSANLLVPALSCCCSGSGRQPSGRGGRAAGACCRVLLARRTLSSAHVSLHMCEPLALAPLCLPRVSAPTTGRACPAARRTSAASTRRSGWGRGERWSVHVGAARTPEGQERQPQPVPSHCRACSEKQKQELQPFHTAVVGVLLVVCALHGLAVPWSNACHACMCCK